MFGFRIKNKPLHSVQLMKQNLLNDDTPSQVNEAYKNVRTNLQYALHPINGKVMLVSSALPGEGKSTTSSNLAVTFAQNSKVLLIDADMRKPVMHKIFGLDNSHGLSLFLGGFEPLVKSINRDVVPGLDVMTAGTIPPNPSELLGSKNMTVFLNKVQEHYDYVIIDTPPINVVTDAVVLSKKVSGVVLVARQNNTTIKMLRQTVEALKTVRVRVLGVVLTGVKEKYKPFSRYSGGYSYYSNRKYSYKYYEYYTAGSRHGSKRRSSSHRNGDSGSSSHSEPVRSENIDVDSIIGEDNK
ncbi:MAG: CpsD/CapB family tyrosine-protein kinase [Ruminococcaceae bacterium]|nr:CpsD/CapB family tyrosine-protein kinase [Oscillospiraceae bacterium]